MERNLYYKLVHEKRFIIQKILIQNLPPTRERMIIHENLWTSYLIRVLSKVHYLEIETSGEALAIFKRQARDVKYDFFRAKARNARNLLIDIDFGEKELADSSRTLVETYEQKDMLQKIIGQLSDEDVEFLNVAILQGRPHKQVAIALNCKVDSVKKKVSRLYKKLNHIYQNLKNS